MKQIMKHTFILLFSLFIAVGAKALVLRNTGGRDYGIFCNGCMSVCHF